MSNPFTMQGQPASRPRLLEWVKIILIVFAAGPPIGGLVFAVIGFFILRDAPWHMLPMALMTAPIASYLVGVPLAAVALTLFIPLQFFVPRGTVYLAAFCGVAAAEIGELVWHIRSIPSFLASDHVMGFVVFGIPSAISAVICWYITRHLHRLR